MIRVALLSMVVALSGAMVPGPLFAVTLYEARLVGWSAGVWLIAGHMLAELLLVALLFIGLGGVLKRPLVTRTIGIIGGAVLLYLAWGMVATALGQAPLATEQAAATHTPAGLILQGLLLTVINPYWYIWWATAGIGLVAAQTGRHGRRAWPVFFTGHILGDYLWYVAVSTTIAIAGSFISDALYRGLIVICGAFVAALGVGFLIVSLRPRPREDSPAPEGTS